jgi:hypothetical protein
MNMEFELLMMALNGLFFFMGALAFVVGGSLSVMGTLGVLKYQKSSYPLVFMNGVFLGIGLFVMLSGLCLMV